MNDEILTLTIDLPASIELLGPILTALCTIDGLDALATSEGLDSELVIKISRKQ